jgi:hypothetical protein
MDVNSTKTLAPLINQLEWPKATLSDPNKHLMIIDSDNDDNSNKHFIIKL